MWRFITITLVLFFLVQNASALSIVEHSQKHSIQQSNIAQDEQHISVNLDEHQPQHLFNLPRINTFSPATFSIEAQTAPIYVLVIEFFKPESSAREYKNLAPPPLLVGWFEQLHNQASSSRISGWKDGNFLYTAKLTYHS